MAAHIKSRELYSAWCSVSVRATVFCALDNANAGVAWMNRVVNACKEM